MKRVNAVFIRFGVVICAAYVLDDQLGRTAVECAAFLLCMERIRTLRSDTEITSIK